MNDRVSLSLSQAGVSGVEGEGVMASSADIAPGGRASAQSFAGQKGQAIISDCGKYRYRLERHKLSGAGAVAWIMVNPSTADASADDATIRKVIGFSERLGAGWAIVGNKFAYRATDVRELRSVADPKGPENDAHLAQIIRAAPLVIVAWGPLVKLPKELRRRWRTICKLADEAGVKLMCLGTAQDGHPRHPLMLAYDTPLVEWKRPL
jgi:hypothetical protein